MTIPEIRQTVDEINPHKGPAFFVMMAGGRYDGRMHPLTGPDLILFTDPVTRSTMGLRENEVTIGTVWRKIQAKRAEYAAAMNRGR